MSVRLEVEEWGEWSDSGIFDGTTAAILYARIHYAQNSWRVINTHTNEVQHSYDPFASMAQQELQRFNDTDRWRDRFLERRERRERELEERERRHQQQRQHISQFESQFESLLRAATRPRRQPLWRFEDDEEQQFMPCDVNWVKEGF